MRFTLAGAYLTITDIMNIHESKKEQAASIITKWYKHFGIDYIFSDIKTIKQKKVNNIPDVRPFSEPSIYKTPDGPVFETLDDLRNFVMNNDICGLKKTSRNTVFADGDPGSRIMIIGEAPGEEEDIQAKPFVGQSGMLLNNMLRAVGLNRSDTYITNIVFWRPPANRTPSSDEIVKCLPYVKKHIELIKPKVILLLGGVAIRAIMNTTGSISSAREQKLKYNGIDVIATFHPAYLLRSPSQKALSFSDMIKLAKSII